MKKLLLIALFIPFLASSQEDKTPGDFQIWYGARVDKSLNKKFTLGGRLDVRTRNNASTIYKYFGGVFGEYKVLDFYSVALRYRYTNWGIGNTHRIDLDNSFNYKIDKEAIDLRLKLQREFGWQTTLEDRIRLRLRYQHIHSKRFKVYASAEYFYSRRYNLSSFNQQRYTVGTRFRVALKHFVTVYARYQRKYNIEFPRQDFTLGLIYNLKL